MATTITYPVTNATHAGQITITATSNDLGLSGIRFYIDGNPIAPTDTKPPYTATLDTFSLINGTHNIQAKSQSSQNTEASVLISTNNTDPSVVPTIVGFSFAFLMGIYIIYLMRFTPR